MPQQAPLYLREDMAIIQAGVTGVNLPHVYSWASLEGGVLESTSVFTRPGGMLPGRQLGGPSERTDVTVHRQMIPELQPYVVQVDNVVGVAAAWVSYTLLDRNKTPTGPTVHMTGVLKSMARPNFDANNTAALFFGLVIALDQQATTNT